MSFAIFELKSLRRETRSITIMLNLRLIYNAYKILNISFPEEKNMFDCIQLKVVIFIPSTTEEKLGRQKCKYIIHKSYMFIYRKIIFILQIMFVI